MKQITFASFKGGAGKTTAAMAVASALIASGKRVALLDADENFPLLDWRAAAQSAGTWDERCEVDVSRNCSAPLTAYYALKENTHGKQTNSRI